MNVRESKTKKGKVEEREMQINYMQDKETVDTHSIGTDEDSSICSLALVKAGVVHNPLSGQCERL